MPEDLGDSVRWQPQETNFINSLIVWNCWGSLLTTACDHRLS